MITISEPIIEKDVVPIWLFMSLQDDLEYMSLSQTSTPETPWFWSIDNNDVAGRNTILMCMTYVQNRVQKHIPYHLKYDRTMVNGATANQLAGMFHTDVQPEYYGPRPSHVSAVLYTCVEWNTQWGGETVIKKPDGSYGYATYIPNNIVIFPASWHHYGASPNGVCPILRTSIGYRFQICYNSPITPN